LVTAASSFTHHHSLPILHLIDLFELNAYSQDVQQIFIGDPNLDQVRTLLQGYTDDVTREKKPTD
jgi:hypothetical protein